MAERGQQRHRDAADAAGRAGDQYLAGAGSSPCRSRAITASIAVNPAVPIAIAWRAVSPSGSRTR